MRLIPHPSWERARFEAKERMGQKPERERERELSTILLINGRITSRVGSPKSSSESRAVICFLLSPCSPFYLQSHRALKVRRHFFESCESAGAGFTWLVGSDFNFAGIFRWLVLFIGRR